MVQEENQAVTKAAKKLSIKLCTARIILKKYKETGLFPMKPMRKSGKGRGRECREVQTS
jgi:transposase